MGDFQPSAFRTENFEVGYVRHRKGEAWPKHYHTSIEINLLVQGFMMVDDVEITPGTIFVIEPYEAVQPIFLEDCMLVVVRNLSAPGCDKILGEAPHVPKQELLPFVEFLTPVHDSFPTTISESSITQPFPFL